MKQLAIWCEVNWHGHSVLIYVIQSSTKIDAFSSLLRFSVTQIPQKNYMVGSWFGLVQILNAAQATVPQMGWTSMISGFITSTSKMLRRRMQGFTSARVYSWFGSPDPSAPSACTQKPMDVDILFWLNSLLAIMLKLSSRGRSWSIGSHDKSNPFDRRIKSPLALLSFGPLLGLTDTSFEPLALDKLWGRWQGVKWTTWIVMMHLYLCCAEIKGNKMWISSLGSCHVYDAGSVRKVELENEWPTEWKIRRRCCLHVWIPIPLLQAISSQLP